MTQDLVALRAQVAERVDRAVDGAWPARQGDDYVREMLSAADQLETIARDMRAEGLDPVELSRTYRILGSVYADLEPALGTTMLHKAVQTYRTAETLLEGQTDELERAKLNFNIANALRLVDANDMVALQDAKQRLLAAQAYFAKHAPNYLAQIDTALQSVETLLRLAPLAATVQRNIDDMAALQQQLASGKNVSDIAAQTREVMKRGGGVSGLAGRVQALIETLPEAQKQSAAFADVQKQMKEVTGKILGSNNMTPEDKKLWSKLTERVQSELDGRGLPEDRAGSLSGTLEEFGRILSDDEGDVDALRAKLQRMREFIESKFELTHYLSHGIPRPPAGSRAADLVELNWQLRRYLLEEMTRSERGEEESKETLDLSMRATRVDKRIYEAGADDQRALAVEKEELRPLALTVRGFSTRAYTMPARPIWHTARVPVDTNAAFYSGAAHGRQIVARVCRSAGLTILPAPSGESYASARWKQLQKAVTAVFDLRAAKSGDLATSTYELGLALVLGRPVVVLVAEDQGMPFDIDIDPVVLAGGPTDERAIATAIDKSIVWTYPKPAADPAASTQKYVLARYPRPQQSAYADQMLRSLAQLDRTPDPLAVTRILTKLFDYFHDGATMIIHPWWPPAYPQEDEQRLFHVMPYRPSWADAVTEVTRQACQQAAVRYVRGDEVAEPNVIRSIWEEIARATHVLVELTGGNANVALELGMAHVLGKNVLMLAQGDPQLHLFRSIEKLRVQPYDLDSLQATLGAQVANFLASR